MNSDNVTFEFLLTRMEMAAIATTATFEVSVAISIWCMLVVIE